MAGFLCIAEGDGQPVKHSLAERMLSVSSHRGPRGSGVLLEGCRAFAQMQLLSRAGGQKQPLQSSNGDLVLVCDARLDARRELQRDLDLAEEAPTDAELILGSYRRWGIDGVRRLNGDFAFALWDRPRDRLLCARDCFGVKPLHYLWIDGTFAAASEAQQLLQHPKASRRLDEAALGRYLVNDESDEEASFFRDIRRLPPGHLLILEGGVLQVRPDARLEMPPRVQYRRDEEYAEHFLELLSSAVTSRLENASPKVGIFLSGGLDSSSVATLAHRRLRATGSRSLLAASYAFPGLEDCDESRWTSVLERELDLDVHRIDVEQHWLLNSPEVWTPDLETPFQGWQGADRAVLALFEEAGVEVALTGLGGDNLTQGSHQVFRSLILRGRLRAGLQGVTSYARDRGLSVPRAVLRYLVAPSLPPKVVRFGRRALGREGRDSDRRWLDPGFARSIGLGAGSSGGARGPRVSRDPARQVCFELVSVLDSVARSCRWLDRLAARFGIEMRHPFLDRRLASFVLAIPPEKLFDGTQRKVLLRRAMDGILPEKVRRRRGKTSFGSFIERSLQVEAASTLRRLLTEDSMLEEVGLVRGEALSGALERFFAGKDDDAFRESLWFLTTLEIWLRAHFGKGCSHLMPLESGLGTGSDLQQLPMAI